MNEMPRLDAGLRAWLERGTDHFWIGGGRVESPPSRDRLTVEDPATESIIARIPVAESRDIDGAVASARHAFGSWRRLAAAERERHLLAFASLLEARRSMFEDLIVLENGKLKSAASREVEASVRFARYMAGWATKITGQTLDTALSDPHRAFFAYTVRDPVGIVAGIIPWNMPLSMAIWKSLPALACGCAVILKPGSEAPLSSLLLAELATEAGLPDGILSVVPGDDRTGAALVDHSGISKVSFTGSTAAGKQVGAAAMKRLARVSLELGGKSPAIVMDDVDLDQAAAEVARGIFYNQGQICAAGSRLLVARSVFEEVVARVAAIADRLRLGSGFDPTAEIGPLVSRDQRDRVTDFIGSALRDGARPRTAQRPAITPGYFVRPTVFTDAQRASRIVREEVFGPVLVAIPFDSEDEAVELANDTRFGLSASIYTRDLSVAHRMIPRLEAGTVFVNSAARTDPNLPFGGFKESGIGREHGSAMIDLYTETKTVVIGYQR